MQESFSHQPEERNGETVNTISEEAPLAEEEVVESREQEPAKVVARLIFVRHFPSLYQEREGVLTENRDLVHTLEQKAKNKQRASTIAKKFRGNDVVAFWTSPAQRAQGTKEVLKERVKRPVVKDKNVSSLRDVKVPSDQYMSYIQKNISQGWFRAYRETPPEGKAGQTRVESVEEVDKRLKSVFQAFNRFVRTTSKSTEEKEVVNVIAVTHGEVPNSFLESIFGFGYSHHGDYLRQELGRGESLAVEARRTPDGALRYFAKMRGKTVEFSYDPRTREFQPKVPPAP